MSDKNQKETPQKILFEPGQLDKTRKNLGNIDAEEAQRVANLLGGEIGFEKSTPVDRKKVRKIATSYRSVNRSTKNKAHKSQKDITSGIRTNYSNSVATTPSQRKYSLPEWDSKNLTKLTKLMSSQEYRIQQSPNILERLLKFAIGYNDSILPEYIEGTLRNHIAHIDKFIHAIKYIVALATPLLQNKISEKQDWPEKVLNYIVNWDIQPIKIRYLSVQTNVNSMNIKGMVSFIKEMYKSLIPLFFIGEPHMTKIIKNTYSVIATHSPEKQQQLLKYSKIAASEWLYINGQTVKNMYPLLMRIASTEMHPYPDYFTTNISDILKFLDLTKYDIILPQKDKSAEKAREKKTNEEAEKKAQIEQKQKEKEQQIVNQSLEVLQRLFPEVGWERLDTLPDMFPYFQPLYHFQDGFNLISEKNPLQITLILLRIIEDLFQACRHIEFTVQGDLDFVIENDSMQNIFATWSLYRDDILGKQLMPDLKEFVSHLHKKSDYAFSSFGKRTLSNWLWLEKFYFLPKLSFELVFIERPNKDSTYLPLSPRVKYLKRTFSTIIQRADIAAKKYEDPYKANLNIGASNLWDQYEFEIQNTVSKRLSILLGGKKSSYLTNLNLLKYTLCTINILDWWINSNFSPAYQNKLTTIYRIDEEGLPVFSVPLLSNQNRIFNQHIRKSANKAKLNNDAPENSEANTTTLNSEN